MTRSASRNKHILGGLAACWLIAGCYDGQSAQPEAAVGGYIEAMIALDTDYLAAHTCEGSNVELLVSRLREPGAAGRALLASLVFEPAPQASTANRLVYEATVASEKVRIVMRTDLDHCVEALE